MARVATSWAVEIHLTSLRVADDDRLRIHRLLSPGIGDNAVEKRRQIPCFVGRQIRKCGHAALRYASLHERPKVFAVIVIQHDERARQVGALRAARIDAMAEAAVRAERVASAIDGCRIRRSSRGIWPFLLLRPGRHTRGRDPQRRQGHHELSEARHQCS
jgi:hypothetical protein